MKSIFLQHSWIFQLLFRVKVNPKFYRPTEVEQLLGDPTKAKTKLGWKPKVMQ